MMSGIHGTLCWMIMNERLTDSNRTTHRETWNLMGLARGFGWWNEKAVSDSCGEKKGSLWLVGEKKGSLCILRTVTSVPYEVTFMQNVLFAPVLRFSEFIFQRIRISACRLHHPPANWRAPVSIDPAAWHLFAALATQLRRTLHSSFSHFLVFSFQLSQHKNQPAPPWWIHSI